MKPIIIEGQRGLGDNIFARPFIRCACSTNEVWFDTPWPELVEDLPVKFVRPETRLRTQAKNVVCQDASRWVKVPHDVVRIKIAYGHASLIAGNITQAIEKRIPLNGFPYTFDLPDMGPSPLTPDRPIAFIRPATVRSEWTNTARNPRPEYVNAIAEHLMATHHVVLIADIVSGVEWSVGPLPSHHSAFVHGELTVRPLLALLRDADVVVGGVGWIVPASIALGVKAFIILGGQAKHNAPHVITDPRMNLSNIGFATPRSFCQCHEMKHNCDKQIPNLAEQWNSFAIPHGLPSSANSPLKDSFGFRSEGSAIIPSNPVTNPTTGTILNGMQRRQIHSLVEH